MPWTEQESAQAAAHAAEGWSGSEIGAAIGKTRNAVIGHLARRGVALSAKRADDSLLRRLYLAAVPVRVIADQIGISFGAVRSRLAGLRGREQIASRRVMPPTVRAARRAPRPAVGLEPLSVALFDLERDQCRYPLGDFGQVTTHFCGHKVEEKQSYCPHHCRICFNAPSP